MWKSPTTVPSACAMSSTKTHPPNANAWSPRRGRGPDQAPGDGLDAHPGTPGDAAEVGDPGGAELSSVDLL